MLDECGLYYLLPCVDSCIQLRVFVFFFFKQKPAYDMRISDWSSDVCSSDLWLGEKGREFGVVTGRKRRCGWFDAALVRQSVKLNGIHGIALTKLDVLDGLDELKICTGYALNGKRQIGRAHV